MNLAIEATSNTNCLKKRGPRKKIYTCPLCNKQFVGKPLYTYHMKKNHRAVNKNHQVVKKNNRVVLPTKRMTRKKGKSNKRTHVCFVCNQKLENMAEYKTHIKQIHRLNMDLTAISDCPICNITVRRYNLDSHLQQNHQTALDKFNHFACANCERIFNQYDDLMYHKRMDHGESRNSNHETEDEEVDANSCQHTRTRSSERNRSFSTDSLVIKHEVKCLGADDSFTTEKDRPFKCSYCQASFTYQGNKSRHEEKCRSKQAIAYHPAQDCTPGGVKIIHANHLYCDYCPKSFSTVANKEIHERIHTGETPYLCSNCNASFRLPQTLSDHEKKCATLIDVIWCDFCDFQTKCRINLKTHYQSWHGLQLDAYETLSRERNSNSRPNNMVIPRQENYDMEISEEKFSIKDEAKTRFVIEDGDKDHWSQFIIVDDEDDD